ncbi:putative costunolide synthase [Dioscorea sansibarensis]
MDEILDYQFFVIIVLVSIVTPLLALLALIIFNFNLRSRRRRKNLPPGPWRLRVIGNLHHLGELPHRSLRHLAEKYGPLISLQLGQIPAIIVSSPEVASEIMKTHDLAFCSRPATPVFMKFSYSGSDMAFSKYSEHWRQLKRLGTLEILSMKRVQYFRSVREDEVHVLIQSIRRSCSQAPVNLSEMFLCMSNNIICRELFGKRFSDDGECNRSEHHDLVLEWLSVSLVYKESLRGASRRINDLFEREIEEHSLSLMNYQGRDDKEEEDFVDVLLKSQKDSTNLGFALTRDQIKGVLLVKHVLGGTDTSAATLEWAMTELMRYPLTMKKAQDEVRSVVGNKGKVEENDLQHLQYLKLIINETCACTVLFHFYSLEKVDKIAHYLVMISPKTQGFL